MGRCIIRTKKATLRKNIFFSNSINKMTTTFTKKIWKVDWTKNASKAGGAQAQVLTEMTVDQIPLCTITQKNGRAWAAVDKEQYIKLTSKNHGIYEIIRPDSKRKVYFDVDWKGGENDCSLDTIKNKILEKFPDALFAVSGSITEAKTSYHIVLLNYHFNTQEDQHKMMRWINTITYLGIDNCVYTKNRLMKCINQSKPDGRVQQDLSDNTIEEHSILFVKDEKSKDASTLDWGGSADEETKDPTTGEKVKRIDILNIPQLNLPNPEEFDWFEANPRDILSVIPNYKKTDPSGAILDHNTTWKIMLWARENKLTFEMFWSWCKQSDNDIERMGRYNHYWIRGGHSPGIFFIKTILERFYPNITRDRSTEKFLKSFEIPNEILSKGQYLTKDDLNVREKFVLLTGSMGSNKTGSVIEKLNPKNKILWLTPRKTLTHNTLERLASSKKGFQFKNYLDFKTPAKKKQIQTFDHLSCCLPSLWLTGEQIYDTVVIDEIETLNMMWKGGQGTPGADKIEMNFPRFRDIIKSAKKVYLMDAFMNARTPQLLQEIDPKAKVLAIKNPEPPAPRYFIGVPDYKTWVAEIGSQLKAGKNIFVFYPYKNSSAHHISMLQLVQTLSLVSGLPESDFIHYNADQADNVKKTTQNVNEVWAKKKCVITNSCITVGVNFDAINHFDCVFSYYAKWVSQRDFFQVLYRCRKITTDNIYIFSEGGGRPSPWIHSNLADPIYRNMLNGLKYEFNSTGSNDVFKYFAWRANIQFKGKIEQSSQQVKQQVDEMIEKSECLFRWDRIKEISFTQYENSLSQIINSWTTSIDTGLQVRKYIFKHLFHENTPENVVADVWNAHRFQAVDGIHALIKNDTSFTPETKIIKSIFADNNAVETFELPKHPKWDYNIDEVRESFETRIVGEQAQHNSQLVSNILKAYFGMSVLVPTKDRSHIEGQHGHKKTDYKMTDGFLTIKNELVRWLDRGEEKSQPLEGFAFSDDI